MSSWGHLMSMFVSFLAQWFSLMQKWPSWKHGNNSAFHTREDLGNFVSISRIPHGWPILQSKAMCGPPLGAWEPSLLCYSRHWKPCEEAGAGMPSYTVQPSHLQDLATSLSSSWPQWHRFSSLTESMNLPTGVCYVSGVLHWQVLKSSLHSLLA